jgi:alcohol dehydrogenase
MSPRANWSYPTAIRFGAGRISEIAEACAAAGIKKPLLVTDRGLAKPLPITARARPDGGRGSWPRDVRRGRSEPDEIRTWRPASTASSEGGHDGVIAFGGGSGLDLGKLVAFRRGRRRRSGISRTSATGGPAPTPTRSRRSSPCRRRPAPARRSAAPASDQFGHPREEDHLPPQGAAVGGHLRPGTDRRHAEAITVGTGMDAFAHCLEAYSRRSIHPMSQGIALEGMRLVKENLPRVVADGPTSRRARR